MAFAVPLFPEYLAYGGDPEEELEEENEGSANVIGRTNRRRAPMLGVVDRRHSAPNMSNKVKVANKKYNATDETDVSKILKQKQVKVIEQQLSKEQDNVDERVSFDEPEKSGSVKPKEEEAPKVHKAVSRGESVLVLLRRLSSGKMQISKPAKKPDVATSQDDDTHV